MNWTQYLYYIQKGIQQGDTQGLIIFATSFFFLGEEVKKWNQKYLQTHNQHRTSKSKQIKSKATGRNTNPPHRRDGDQAPAQPFPAASLWVPHSTFHQPEFIHDNKTLHLQLPFSTSNYLHQEACCYKTGKRKSSQYRHMYYGTNSQQFSPKILNFCNVLKTSLLIFLFLCTPLTQSSPSPLTSNFVP